MSKNDNALYFHMMIPKDDALVFLQTDGAHIFNGATITGPDQKDYLEIGCKVVEIGGKPVEFIEEELPSND